MNKPPKEIMEIVLASLRLHPEDWKFTNYEAYNPKLDTLIWFGNRHYGTSLRVGSVKWGDVTMAATFFGWAMRWRRRLVKAARFAALRHAMPVQPLMPIQRPAPPKKRA